MSTRGKDEGVPTDSGIDARKTFSRRPESDLPLAPPSARRPSSPHPSKPRDLSTPTRSNTTAPRAVTEPPGEGALFPLPPTSTEDTNTRSTHTSQLLPVSEQLADRITYLRNTYRLPSARDVGDAGDATQNTSSKRRSAAQKARPPTDRYFAAAISDAYRRNHPDDPEQKGVFTTEYFRLLRTGRRDQPAVEKLQAIAEFFGVDVGFLLPTRTSPTALTLGQGAVTALLPSEDLRTLSDNLAARRERVILLINELPSDQLSQFERQVEHAIQIARRALSEFTPSPIEPEETNQQASAPPFPATPVTATALDSTDTDPRPASPASLETPATKRTLATNAHPQPITP